MKYFTPMTNEHESHEQATDQPNSAPTRSNDQEKKPPMQDVKGVARRLYHPPPHGPPGEYPYKRFHSNAPMLQRPMGPPIERKGDDVDLAEAMAFLNDIKDSYTGNVQVYDKFLETMRDFRLGKYDAEEVCKAVRILFKECPKLISNFDEYLPHHLRFADINGFERGPRDASSFPFTPSNPFPQKTMMPIPPPPHHPMMHGQRPPIHPQRHIVPPPEQRPLVKQKVIEPDSALHGDANKFIHLVKQRYGSNPSVYRNFLGIIQKSNAGFDKMLNYVASLMAETPDLVTKFEKFFRPKAHPGYDSEYEKDPLYHVREVLKKKGLLDEFFKALNFYNQGYWNADDLLHVLKPLLNNSEEDMEAVRKALKHSHPAPNKKKKHDNIKGTKIGSYVILNEPLKFEGPELAVELLNNHCISVSTYNSEEDAYIFRTKNNSEDILIRVADERYEADLQIDRLKLLIGTLEDLLGKVGENEIDMDDIKMSGAIVCETLKMVYGDKSTEVLNSVLSTPEKALPVILKRLHCIYRLNATRHRECKKHWRYIVDYNYYRAYDTRGCNQKLTERGVFNLRNIQLASEQPFELDMSDKDLLNNIQTCCNLLFNSQNDFAEDFKDIMDSIFALLKSSDSEQDVGFEKYSLYYFICEIYQRLLELKNINFEPLTSNPMAVDIGLQDEFNITDRFNQVIVNMKNLAEKKIDSDCYEENVRQMTESKGYKLYNMRKLFDKIEKQVMAVYNIRYPEAEDAEGRYSICKAGDILRVKMVSHAVSANSVIEDDDEE